MSRILTHATSLCLIGTGVFVWAFAGRPLVSDQNFNIPLNPLGINGGPYGEVFAMAMQGPIDTYIDMGMNGQGHEHSETDGHDHEHDHDHDACKETGHEQAPNLAKRFEEFLAELNEVPEIRTNPFGAGNALKLYLRRQAEDKLRFAYKLDPSHYGNYNALHFFLTEPSVGTRPELTPSAAKLAQDTIQYCLKQEHDPRPALTAAAAATNLIHLMFADRNTGQTPKFTTTQMRQCMDVLDVCIARYNTVAKEWDDTKNWELLSSQRIEECEERIRFICKIRDAAKETIPRFEGKLPNQASN